MGVHKFAVTRIPLALVLVTALVATALISVSVQARAEARMAEGFHWGVATSGFQVEGSNMDSNWKRYVDAAAARGEADPVNDAVDFWNRYPEDIARAADLGVNTFRLSVEWSRIEPEPGRYDEQALRRYDDILSTIRAHGMTPMITMVHYVYPGWLVDRGGFLSPDSVEAFGRYAELITERWAGDGTMWVTFNEPLVFFSHELRIGLVGLHQFNAFRDNVVAAHKLGYHAAHRADPDAMVTANEAYLPAFAPATDDLLLNHIRDELDFIGVDYYYGIALDNLTTIRAAWDDFAGVRPQPEGMYESIVHYARHFPGKPLFIVENGMPTHNGYREDSFERGDYLRDVVFWIQRAVADGYPVIGYNHWSLVDNYEWGTYDSRFGLYQVDVLTDPALERRPTSGVDAYRDVIAGGGVPEGYRPVLPVGTCSLGTIPDTCLRPVDVHGPLARLAG
ncbi:glycoside hydrolase family 1 protein [Dietzia natronolimnaea]|uniref:glycoside hydrolase family 1 protein n=1 Tax=Dietzia natronolimnaea TaxID=161920 RepID=UPI0015FDBDB6|nr:family 1 glycosylhydrolase [Dietzia natronolimnaea]MBB1037329.1 glycoside hydrolase family 1 protein [Dietzia natronolimnaea]MBC7296968.1 glycoside hydrolase family 1 protein [Dietzia sp.]